MNNEFTRAPHRFANTPGGLHNAALMIDFDNVTMGIRSNLGQELRNLLESDVIKGKVAVQRAYADWRRYPQYIVPLSESSIDLIFAPAYGSSRKNATDIRLAIDALELVFTRPEIGTFILLSGDSDFSSLVLKLKEYGKYVIGVGLQESTSDILVQNCDEYYSYNTLSGLTSADDMPTERLDPWVLVERAIKRMVERNDVMRSDRLKQVMLEMDPSFDEKTTGYNKFNRFLAEAAHRDLVRMRKGENGQYEVAPGGATAAATQPAAPAAQPAVASDAKRQVRATPRKRARRDRGERKPAFEGEVPEVALKQAYEQLARVVDELYDGRDPVRDSMAKRKLLQHDANFDEGALGFRKFSRFLQQAHEDGVIVLKQLDDGNFYITPGEDGAAGAGTDAAARRDTGGRQAREVRSGRGAGAARRGRGGRRGGRRGRGRDRVGASEEPAAKPDEGGAESPRADSPEEERASVASAPETPPEASPAGSGPEPESEKPESTFEAAKNAARRTLGRFRRGSQGVRPDAAATPGPKPQIGPVNERGEVEPPAKKPETAPPAPPETSATQRHRGLGKRSGSRGAQGRSGAAAGEGPREAEGGAAPAPEPSGESATESEVEDAVTHMVRNYSGVGKRTAEVLVDRFGASVFEIIDHEPHRLTEVISEARAQAVVAGRQAERAGR